MSQNRDVDPQNGFWVPFGFPLLSFWFPFGFLFVSLAANRKRAPFTKHIPIGSDFSGAHWMRSGHVRRSSFGVPRPLRGGRGFVKSRMPQPRGSPQWSTPSPPLKGFPFFSPRGAGEALRMDGEL